ncbi:cytochrome ubiquinol oxidase subunit I [Sulfuriflexus mobilis]|uniref:cytochrome ubiquinol oxidase subunit I n=1 Tax=Sulfuriflexus mobilis TaxID=1811807 RepID=UPI000F822762|nr:cytochrome ubiquinol oxidase subunit I [Sulfuriflexus mobilis]
MDLVANLSRLQFGLTAGFHIIFPTLLIGLSTYLCLLYWRWLRTDDRVYLDSYNLWLRLLLIIYVVAAITGVALSAQLDNLFGGFYRRLEDTLVPFRNYELIFATLLEGGCIGVMLLCTQNQRSYKRFAATLLFTFGIFLTAFFVVSRNSWMNTPAGFTWNGDHAEVFSALQVLLNPSFPLRYLHMITAGLMASSFFIMGLSAYRLLRHKGDRVARKGMHIGMTAGLIFSIAQFVIGDLHGLDVYQHQPMKIAALEGQWETERGAGFKVFALPDQKNASNRYEVEIPYALSLVIKHDPDGEVRGLKELPPAERPNVAMTFFSFRIMIAMAIIMLVTAVIGVWIRRRAEIESKTWYLRLAMLTAPAGLIAVVAGWSAAEAGRQPWTIYGIVKTVQTVTTQSNEQVIASLLIFSVSYTALGILALIAIRQVLLGRSRLPILREACA